MPISQSNLLKEASQEEGDWGKIEHWKQILKIRSLIVVLWLPQF